MRDKLKKHGQLTALRILDVIESGITDYDELLEHITYTDDLEIRNNELRSVLGDIGIL
jgi:hypothetical protein